jgi:hypothetical protein
MRRDRLLGIRVQEVAASDDADAGAAADADAADDDAALLMMRMLR